MLRSGRSRRNPDRARSGRVTVSFLSVALSLALLGLVVAAEAGGGWQTAAVAQLNSLEEDLSKKEMGLLDMKAQLKEMSQAEERAGRRYVRRAAFDVGSGATKILVADIDLHAGMVPSISKVVFQKKVSILMSEDLQKSENTAFGSGILHELMETLKEFKREAQANGAEQFAGGIPPGRAPPFALR